MILRAAAAAARADDDQLGLRRLLDQHRSRPVPHDETLHLDVQVLLPPTRQALGELGLHLLLDRLPVQRRPHHGVERQIAPGVHGQQRRAAQCRSLEGERQRRLAHRRPVDAHDRRSTGRVGPAAHDHHWATALRRQRERHGTDHQTGDPAQAAITDHHELGRARLLHQARDGEPVEHLLLRLLAQRNLHGSSGGLREVGPPLALKHLPQVRTRPWMVVLVGHIHPADRSHDAQRCPPPTRLPGRPPHRLQRRLRAVDTRHHRSPYTLLVHGGRPSRPDTSVAEEQPAGQRPTSCPPRDLRPLPVDRAGRFHEPAVGSRRETGVDDQDRTAEARWADVRETHIGVVFLLGERAYKMR
jgi:hypothetical protein